MGLEVRPMDDHERVYVDALIHEACDLLCQTSIQRLAGPTNVLRRLREDPNGEGIWLDRFVSMLFEERGLDSDSGACAVLEALARREMPAIDGGSIGEVLRAASRAAFAGMVRVKAEEALELASSQEMSVEEAGVSS